MEQLREMNLDYLLTLLNEIEPVDRHSEPTSWCLGQLPSTPEETLGFYDGNEEVIPDIPEKQSLESSLKELVENMFKLLYWEVEQGRDCRHWQSIVSNSRSDIQKLLHSNPIVKKHLENIYPELYQDVVNAWQKEFYVPENMPLELEQILDRNYLG